MCLGCGCGKGAAEAAQGILDSMRSSYAAGNIRERPDIVTYGATMPAWERSGREDAVDWAVALLDEMEDLWKAGDRDVGTYRVAYNAALNALSKSGTDKSARRVESLLRRIKELFRNGNGGYSDMRLETISYTSVMNAWAGCGIIRLIRNIFRRSSGRGGRDAVTYEVTNNGSAGADLPLVQLQKEAHGYFRQPGTSTRLASGILGHHFHVRRGGR